MTYSVEWNYFLTIEEDFIKTIPFAEPSENNFDTYSTQYAKILLAAASETDTILKRLCKAIDPSCKKRSEQSYREFLVKEHKVPLYAAKTKILQYNLSSAPWESYEFEKPETPDWWTAYNKVKHHLDEGFKKATLKNALCSICGLFVSILFLSEKEGGRIPLSCAPANRHRIGFRGKENPIDQYGRNRFAAYQQPPRRKKNVSTQIANRKTTP